MCVVDLCCLSSSFCLCLPVLIRKATRVCVGVTQNWHEVATWEFVFALLGIRLEFL